MDFADSWAYPYSCWWWSHKSQPLNRRLHNLTDKQTAERSDDSAECMCQLNGRKMLEKTLGRMWKMENEAEAEKGKSLLWLEGRKQKLIAKY